MEHTTTFPDDASASKEVQDCLVNIVHTLVNHQGRIDDGWYEEAVDSLKVASVVLDGNAVQYQSALVEIILLVAMSHAIHTAFLALGKDPVPPLPSFQDIATAPAPSRLDVTSMLKNGKVLRQEDNIAKAPYYLEEDVDKASSEFQNLSDPCQEDLCSLMIPIIPLICTPLAPEDACFFLQFFRIMYVWDNMAVPKAFLALDPNVKCPSVSRFDLECVAGGVATAHQCGF
jgi:hypothetical protein